MGKRLETLEVAIEAQDKKYREALKRDQAETSKVVKGINAELKRIQSPITDNPALKKVQLLQARVRKMIDDAIPAEAKRMTEYANRASEAAGLIRKTAGYQELEKQIRGAETELEKLTEKQKELIGSGRGPKLSQSYKELGASLEKTRKRISELKQEKKALEDSGQDLQLRSSINDMADTLDRERERYNALIKMAANARNKGVKSGVAKDPTLPEKYVAYDEWSKNSNAPLLGEAIQSSERKIQELETKLEKLMQKESSWIPTEQMKAINREIDAQQRKLSELNEQKLKMDTSGEIYQESAAWRNLQQAIENAEIQLDQYKMKRQEMKSSGTMYESAVPGFAENSGLRRTQAVMDYAKNTTLNELMDRLKKATMFFGVFGSAARNAAFIVQKSFSGARAVMNAVTSVIKKVSGAFGALIQRFRNGNPEIRKTRDAMGGIQGSGRGLAGILRTIGISAKFMFASFLIRTGMEAIKTGMQNVAGYCDRTNASISSLISGMNQFKNQAGAAFAPILNTIAPILDTLISYLTAATTAIAHFFAALTGQSTVTIAKRVNTDYAASLNGTAAAAGNAAGAMEDYKRSILGFDEINKLDDTSSSGSGGGGGGAGGSGSLFDTVEVESAYKDLANKVKSFFQDMFKPMQNAWKTYGAATIDAWKSALDETLTLVEEIGKSFVNVWKNGTGEKVCGNILQILTNIGTSIGNIAEAFKNAWTKDNVGTEIVQNLADAFNTCLTHVKNISKHFSNWTGTLNLTPLLKSIQDMAKALSPFSNAVGTGLENFFTDVLIPVGNWTLGEKGLPRFLTVTSDLVSKISWDKLNTQISNLMKSLTNIGIIVFDSVLDFYEYFLAPMVNWTLSTALPELAGILNNLLSTVDWQSLSGALSNFWNAISPFAQSVGNGLINFISDLAETLAPGISGAVSLLADALNAVADFIQRIPSGVAEGIGAALGAIAEAVLIFKGANMVASIVTDIAGALFGTGSGLIAALAAHPLAAIGAGLATIATALILLADKDTVPKGYEDFYRDLDRISESIDAVNDGVKELMDDSKWKNAGVAEGKYLETTWDNYEKLRDKTEKTNEEKQKMADMAKTLVDSLPELKQYYDEETGYISATKDEVYNLIGAMVQKAQAAAQEKVLTELFEQQLAAQQAQKEALDNYSAALQNAADKDKALQRAIENQQEAMEKGLVTGMESADGMDKYSQAVNAAYDATADANKALKDSKTELDKANSAYENVNGAIADVEESLYGQADAAASAAQSTDQSAESLDKQKGALNDGKGALDNYTKVLGKVPEKKTSTLYLENTKANEGIKVTKAEMGKIPSKIESSVDLDTADAKQEVGMVRNEVQKSTSADLKVTNVSNAVKTTKSTWGKLNPAMQAAMSIVGLSATAKNTRSSWLNMAVTLASKTSIAGLGATASAAKQKWLKSKVTMLTYTAITGLGTTWATLRNFWNGKSLTLSNWTKITGLGWTFSTLANEWYKNGFTVSSWTKLIGLDWTQNQLTRDWGGYVFGIKAMITGLSIAGGLIGKIFGRAEGGILTRTGWRPVQAYAREARPAWVKCSLPVKPALSW